MNSDVDLCNEALVLIGADTISALDEDSKEARHCNFLYEGVRDAVQRAHPWNVCIERATLALLEEAPVWGYACQYQLPADPYCLRVLQMEHLDYKFKVEGRKLLTDEGTANILYIARRVDVALFDALLKKAIAARLAADLAYPITDSKPLVEVRFKIYLGVLAEARSIDGQEGTPEEFQADDWTNARR